jgi:hypothetical protein
MNKYILTAVAVVLGVGSISAVGYISYQAGAGSVSTVKSNSESVQSVQEGKPVICDTSSAATTTSLQDVPKCDPLVTEKILYRDTIGSVQTITAPLYYYRDYPDDSSSAAPLKASDKVIEYQIPSYWNVSNSYNQSTFAAPTPFSYSNLMYLSSNPIRSIQIGNVHYPAISDITVIIDSGPQVNGGQSSDPIDNNIKPAISELVCRTSSFNNTTRCATAPSTIGTEKFTISIVGNNSVYNDFKRFIETLTIK